MTPKQKANVLVAGARRLYQAMQDHREGKIAAGENIAQLQQDLIDEFTRVFEERAKS
jgi:hypothetical protein